MAVPLPPSPPSPPSPSRKRRAKPDSPLSARRGGRAGISGLYCIFSKCAVDPDTAGRYIPPAARRRSCPAVLSGGVGLRDMWR
jgi:hypothetical protein